MTCQRISIITHRYSPTGCSASAGHVFVHELVESGYTIKLNFDQLSLLSPESSIWVCRPECHSYAGGYYKWLDQVSDHQYNKMLPTNENSGVVILVQLYL